VNDGLLFPEELPQHTERRGDPQETSCRGTQRLYMAILAKKEQEEVAREKGDERTKVQRNEIEE